MEGGSRGREDKRRALLNNIYAEIDKNISLTLVMIHSKNITEIPIPPSGRKETNAFCFYKRFIYPMIDVSWSF